MVTTCYASAAAKSNHPAAHTQCVSQSSSLTRPSPHRRVSGRSGWPATHHAPQPLRAAGLVPLARIRTRPGSPNSFSTSRMAADNNGVVLPVLTRQKSNVEARGKRTTSRKSWGGCCRARTQACSTCKGTHQTVSGGVLVQRQQMARAFAAQNPTVFSQFFQNVAVTHLGSFQTDATLL